MERKVAEILTEKEIEYIRQKNFEWMKKMKLDFYIPSINLAIECQGIQHYEPIEWFGGQKNYEKQIERDKLKYKLCDKHGIKIEYIKYNEEINKRLKEILV